ncbi:MAG: vWA domain-containing protein, partial [Anaerolineales bacterium]
EELEALTTIQLMEIDEDFDTELCDAGDPRKLVRVVAQINSETTFLRLVGMDDFIISASATSETAALDIALVLDASTSMSGDTTIQDYTNDPLGTGINGAGMTQPATLRENPPNPNAVNREAYRLAANETGNFNLVRGDGSSNLRDYCYYTGGAVSSIRPQHGFCCNDPGASANVAFDEATERWFIYTDGVLSTDPAALAYDPPENDEFGHGGVILNATDFSTLPDGIFNTANGDQLGVRYNVPDGDFSDLVCMPFRQVKDAARNFIQRLDFVRGDRVGLVTFSAQAQVVYPNIGPRNPANVTDAPPPMMVSEEDAIRTLNQFVGIYENPSGDNDRCLAQTAAVADVDANVFVANDIRAANSDADDTNDIDPSTFTFELANGLRPFAYEVTAQCSTTNVGDGLRAANALLTDVDTIRRDSVWVTILLSDGATNSSYYINPNNTFEEGGTDTGNIPEYGDFGFCPWYTFCYNRAPGHPVHQHMGDDALWYDGFSRYGEADPTAADGLPSWDELFWDWGLGDWWAPSGSNVDWSLLPNDGTREYQYVGNFPNVGNGVARLWGNSVGYDANRDGTDDVTLTDIESIFPYPSYAECAASYANATSLNLDIQNQTVTVNGELVNYGARENWFRRNLDLACNDQNPDTRHFCVEWSNDESENGLPPDTTTLTGECGVTGRYDADDYARDMADWAGLAVLDTAQNIPGNFITLFTIGFGEDFSENLSGAALLRYIADAGDNGIIDNNLQQDWRDNGVLDHGTSGTLNGGYPAEFGENDPCFGLDDTQAEREIWCGQYYYARDVQSLEEVFEAIAGRLFTRIAR